MQHFKILLFWQNSWICLVFQNTVFQVFYELQLKEMKAIHIIEFLPLLNQQGNVPEQIILAVDYPLILDAFSDSFFKYLWITEMLLQL